MNSDEIHIKLQQIMEKIYQKPISGFFNSIPNPDQEPQYFALIKNPMSLNIINDKVIRKQYQNYNEFIQDFDKINQNTEIVYGSPSLTLTMFQIVYQIMDKEVKLYRKHY